MIRSAVFYLSDSIFKSAKFHILMVEVGYYFNSIYVYKINFFLSLEKFLKLKKNVSQIYIG